MKSLDTNVYSPENFRKWLTIGALLLTLLGYALPWYRISASILIVSFSGSYYIWGISATGSSFLEQQESLTFTWFNLPAEEIADIVSEGGIGFIAAFFFYALASLALLGRVLRSHSSSVASVVLLLLSVVSFVGTLSYTIQSSSFILFQQGYAEGILVAIVALLLAGGAVAIPLLTRSRQVPPSPPPPPPDAYMREENLTLEKERLLKLLEKLDERLVNGEISESVFQELKSKYLTKLKQLEEEIATYEKAEEAQKLSRQVSCGTCVLLGKTECPRKEEDPKAAPCERYMEWQYGNIIWPYHVDSN